MSKQKKSVAVVGYGGQGGWHAEQIRQSDVVTLAGVYDIKKERNELARSRGIHIYDSPEALLEDETVEIVVIATPNDSHKEIAIRSLRAGKHVICEKPVEMTVAALDEMLSAAKESGKCFAVHQNRRFDVDYLGMKEIVESGRVGKVFRIESRIHGSRGIPSDWRGRAAYGGGMLLDWGVHLIDQILLLFAGEAVKKVDCTLVHTTNFEVDDGFRLTLTFASGATGYIEVGTLNFIPMPRFYLQGMKGTAMITDWREKAKVVLCTHWNESDVMPVQTAAGITKTMAPRDEITTESYEVERPHSDVHDFYRNFTAAIDGREEQMVTWEQSRLVMSIVEAAFRSNEIGAPVEFGG